MSNREFHDAVLRENSIPVDLIRARLTDYRVDARLHVELAILRRVIDVNPQFVRRGSPTGMRLGLKSQGAPVSSESRRSAAWA